MEAFKGIVLNIDVNTDQKDLERTNQEFWSYDHKSARIIVDIKKNNEPLDPASIKTVRLFMASSDRYGRITEGMQYQTEIDQINDSKVIHVLPDEYLRYEGLAVIYIYIDFQNEAKNDAGQAFLISFRRSAIDDSNAENVVPDYFKNFDDILSEVQKAADEKMEEIEELGVDIGDLVEDYLSKSPNIATKEYVDTKANVSDRLLYSWLFLESEGGN